MILDVNNIEGRIKVQYDSMEAIFTNLFIHFYMVLTHIGAVPFTPTVDKKELTITWQLIDTFVEHDYKLRPIKFNRECTGLNFCITDLFLGKEFEEVVIEKDEYERTGMLILTNDLKLHEVQLDISTFKCVFDKYKYLDCRLDSMFLNDCANYARCILENQFEYNEVEDFINQCTLLVQAWLNTQCDYTPFKSYMMKMIALSDSLLHPLHDLDLYGTDNIFLGLNNIFENKPATYINPALLKGSIFEPHDFFMFKLSLSILRYRDIFIFRQGYAALTQKVLDKLVEITKGSKCLELFAGKCIISKYLSDSGVNITPTDSNEYQYGLYTPQYQCMPFEEIDAVDAVKKYSNIDYIITSWIPFKYNSKPLLDAIRKYSPNAKIIHIGELGDCTADDYFEEHYEVLDIKDNQELSELYKSFYNLHDTCTVGIISPESVEGF